MKTIAEIYKAYRNGDALTDQEVINMIDHTKDLEQMLQPFGDTARLVRNEIRMVHDTIKQDNKSVDLIPQW